MKSKITQLFQKLEPFTPNVDAIKSDAANVASVLRPEDIDDGVVCILAERVALHIIDVPIRSARQRYAALPFALEEKVGRPLDRTHFAICEILQDGRVLAAAVDSDVIEQAIASASDKVIVPEQMLLPVEVQDGERSVWAAFRQNDRVLVRISDGTGFAADISVLEHMWRASGMPAINSYGASLPANIPFTDRSIDNFSTIADLKRYDLRQGRYRPASGMEPPLRWLAVSVLLSVLAHLALAFADTRAQTVIAEALRDDAAIVLESRLPYADIDDSLAVLRSQILAQSQPQIASAFLPLMNQISQAWLREGSTVLIRQLSWSDDTLRLVVEAPDLEALQLAEASLKAVNLSVTSGSATADTGSARAELVVQP